MQSDAVCWYVMRGMLGIGFRKVDFRVGLARSALTIGAGRVDADGCGGRFRRHPRGRTSRVRVGGPAWLSTIRSRGFHNNFGPAVISAFWRTLFGTG